MPVKFIDWAGTRVGYLISIVLWSFAAGYARGLVRSAFSLATWRGSFGALANPQTFRRQLNPFRNGFPKHERGLSDISFLTAGQTLQMIIGAPIIAALTLDCRLENSFFLQLVHQVLSSL